MCKYEAGVPAHLVVVESGLVLGGLKALPDRPATAGHPDQLGGFGLGVALTDVVGHLVGVSDRPAGQQPVIATPFATSGVARTQPALVAVGRAGFWLSTTPAPRRPPSSNSSMPVVIDLNHPVGGEHARDALARGRWAGPFPVEATEHVRGDLPDRLAFGDRRLERHRPEHTTLTDMFPVSVTNPVDRPQVPSGRPGGGLLRAGSAPGLD